MHAHQDMHAHKCSSNIYANQHTKPTGHGRQNGKILDGRDSHPDETARTWWRAPDPASVRHGRALDAAGGSMLIACPQMFSQYLPASHTFTWKQNLNHEMHLRVHNTETEFTSASQGIKHILFFQDTNGSFMLDTHALCFIRISWYVYDIVCSVYSLRSRILGCTQAINLPLSPRFIDLWTHHPQSYLTTL